MSFHTVADVDVLRAAVEAWRKTGETVAFVPTMGALHEGHLSLVRAAKQLVGRVIVSIFVNPKQFAPHEDFARYPRPLEQDQALLARVGCDLLFTPNVATIYPSGFSTLVDPGPLATILEGVVRPGHFVGVATVVTRLLSLVAPDHAFFGEKDYQQLLVIRRVVADLALPVAIHGISTVRAPDGLALSSRNAYLSADERTRALVLPQTLIGAAAALSAGTPVIEALQAGSRRIEFAGLNLDYLALCDTSTLAPITVMNSPARLLVAAKCGATRLIDNVPVLPTD